MSEAEREKYVAWWLYESGLEVDELLDIAMHLGSFGQGAPRGHRMNFPGTSGKPDPHSRAKAA